MADPQRSTGLHGLDRLIKGILPGDNLVFQVDSVEDYRPFVEPYCQRARSDGRRLVYFRFADHPPLVPEDWGVETCRMRTCDGFEQFITGIHRILSEAGRGASLVFDLLSTMAEDWCSDRMLGNFFKLTCPYVYDLESVAYFAVRRGCHSFHATTPITETTQILLDAYRHQGRLYVQPIKVQHRYSPTMYMLHEWREDDFLPVTESSTISEILTSRPWEGIDSVRFRLGVWNRAFQEAERTWNAAQEETRSLGRPTQHVQSLASESKRTLLRMIISRQKRFLSMAEKYLSLGDVLGIWMRMIGTGLIGGKAVGMLLARAILKRANARWEQILEAHDSFYVGSDVFYSFLVENGCWWLRQKQHAADTFLDGVEEARRRILTGVFPDDVQKEFAEMLDYFGQSPIIVRSSSLLEDDFGNAFAGKYESVFCANQGPHKKRLEDFMSAVKLIYASTMSEKALRYRAQRQILDRDEQMSLLVQRVSGAKYGHRFYPQVAGVGLSFNPYVWNHYIDPAAGMLRLVFGLGTRAVDRADDDYTRIIALNAPERRPESGTEQVREFSQRKVDVIDLEANQWVSADFVDVARQSPGLPLRLFACESSAQEGTAAGSWPVLTFEHLLSETSFVTDMRDMFRILQDAYDHPVDVEFTLNFFQGTEESYKINLVQCRPLQVAPVGGESEIPPNLAPEDTLLEARGPVIGQSRVMPVDRIVYVVPATYGHLPLQDRYAVARLIGRILRSDAPGHQGRVMLIGPGRWGTTTPSLGIPVSFAEIQSVAVLCEIVAMRTDLVPDVSLGTHFFNDLVEMDILYFALFPERAGNHLNLPLIEHAPSRLVELVAGAEKWAEVVRVIDPPLHSAGNGSVILNANTWDQRVVCYQDHSPDSFGHDGEPGPPRFDGD